MFLLADLHGIITGAGFVRAAERCIGYIPVREFECDNRENSIILLLVTEHRISLPPKRVLSDVLSEVGKMINISDPTLGRRREFSQILH